MILPSCIYVLNRKKFISTGEQSTDFSFPNYVAYSRWIFFVYNYSVYSLCRCRICGLQFLFLFCPFARTSGKGIHSFINRINFGITYRVIFIYNRNNTHFMRRLEGLSFAFILFSPTAIAPDVTNMTSYHIFRTLDNTVAGRLIFSNRVSVVW